MEVRGLPDEERTRLASAEAHRLGLRSLASDLRVVWNPRLRSTAGRAWPGQGVIELNPRLREFGDDEIRRTLLHELAHLVAHARAGRKRIAPHGPEWRFACADLGIAGESARHRLPLPRSRQKRRFRYECPVCGTGIERVRRLRRAAACFTCCKAHAGGRFDKRFQLVERDHCAATGLDP
ncbi:Zn-dependent metalloprotease [Haloferula helveola]|uniref:Zn-dependent metalloprotease n=1 Tax=Haloferula helveola TaxID=490095 RepID=A0ABM7RD34_9BACT|nr:Zn-dependent metalloprotease [Haloferula helveola]